MNWEEIKREYETSDITLKALADKHDIKLGTLKSRKSREGWERDATQSKDATPKQEKVATSKKPDKKRKRSGNPNPKNQFGERNTAALKHGIFSKYLPQETLDIINGMQDKTPEDLLYDQIQIQYATIIRAQKVMWVEDDEDHLSAPITSSADGEMYKVAFAYERFHDFMSVQSRAMGTLANLIKQFDNIAHEDDERRLKIQAMQLGIDKTKAEISNLKNEGSSTEKDVASALRGLVDGINSKAN
jgi:uncharacterized protein YjcR